MIHSLRSPQLMPWGLPYWFMAGDVDKRCCVYAKKRIEMTFSGFRRVSLVLAIGILSSFAPLAFADTIINTVPTGWRLQSYGGSAVLWYTGSTCMNGQLLVDSSWSFDQSKLLWATIMTAKASQIPVFVSYVVNSSGYCIITSFSLDKQ